MTTAFDSAAPAAHPTLTGVACGMGAGALWGFVFLAPDLVPGFTPLDLTAGRYLAYGLLAAGLVAPRLRGLLARVGWRDWLDLAWLSLAGNTLYYLLLSTAVQTGGIAMTSLVIGILPVAVTLIGSRAAGAVPLRRLAPSLIACSAGVVCTGWQAVGSSGAPAGRITGLACALGALASWTAFAVGNSRCLARLDRVSPHEWSLLGGLVTGAQALLLAPLLLRPGATAHAPGDWAAFAAVCAGIAVLSSIAGNALWNRMSRLLPLTLVGQMILFETLFALLYGYAWERRLPQPLEVAAFALVALSVVACLAAHRPPRGPRRDARAAARTNGGLNRRVAGYRSS